MKHFFRTGLVLLVLTGLSSLAHAQTQSIRVEVENLQPADGFYFTPVLAAFHDGSFDYFNANVGDTASAALEAMAETGDLAGLLGEVGAAGGEGFVVTDPAGFGSGAGQPPVFDPGNAAAAVFSVNTGNRYFSYGSMIIPSNDAFIGNDDSMAYEVFDAMGNFNGPITIDVVGIGDVWDAGTEVNDGFGAAFSATGGMDSMEALTVRSHPGLANFLGTDTAAGTTIGSDILAGTPIARITITAIPEPSSAMVLLLAAGVGLVYRRR